MKKSVTAGVGDTSGKFTAGVGDTGEQVTAGVDDGESNLELRIFRKFSKKLRMVPTDVLLGFRGELIQEKNLKKKKLATLSL